MRIGDRVIVKCCEGLKEFNGATGIIIGEQLINELFAFELLGRLPRKWKVKFDNPIPTINYEDSLPAEEYIFHEFELELI